MSEGGSEKERLGDRSRGSGAVDHDLVRKESYAAEKWGDLFSYHSDLQNFTPLLPISILPLSHLHD